MIRRSTILMIFDMCAIAAIPVLGIDAALLGWSGHMQLAMLALGLLGPLLIIEALSIATFLVRMMASPAAREVLKADLIEPGMRWATGEEDRRVRCLRSVMLASGAFTAACLAWFLVLDMSSGVAEAAALAAAIGLILFWASANVWLTLATHVEAMSKAVRDVRLAQMVGGRWSDDGRVIILDQVVERALQW